MTGVRDAGGGAAIRPGEPDAAMTPAPLPEAHATPAPTGGLTLFGGDPVEAVDDWPFDLPADLVPADAPEVYTTFARIEASGLDDRFWRGGPTGERITEACYEAYGGRTPAATDPIPLRHLITNAMPQPRTSALNQNLDLQEVLEVLTSSATTGKGREKVLYAFAADTCDRALAAFGAGGPEAAGPSLPGTVTAIRDYAAGDIDKDRLARIAEPTNICAKATWRALRNTERQWSPLRSPYRAVGWAVVMAASAARGLADDTAWFARDVVRNLAPDKDRAEEAVLAEATAQKQSLKDLLTGKGLAQDRAAAADRKALRQRRRDAGRRADAGMGMG